MFSNTALLSPIRTALETCRRHFFAAAVFSALSNLLYLTPSLFMLQVYDRVVPTGGLGTLAALALLTVAGLAALCAFEWLRSRLLVRASVQLEAELAQPTLKLAMARPDLSRLQRAEVMRDFDNLRQGIGSPGVVAAFDAPWTPIYILAAFLLHPSLGIMAILSAGLLLLLAWLNERATATPMKIAGEAASIAYSKQNHSVAHAAEVRALGMLNALSKLQSEERQTANAEQLRASFASASHSGVIKFFRLALQSAALGLGAVLVVKHAISPGSMIAASLLITRALAPIEQIVGSWKSIVQSRVAYGHLVDAFSTDEARIHTRLPAPTGALQVERLTVLTPQTGRVALAEAHFEVKAGDIVGIVGPSGAGKSTLLKAIAGATPAARGHIRFDGASREDWDSEELARHVGYLPQDFILFPGSVKDNISRFRRLLGDDPAKIDTDTIAAAQAVGAHDMIVRLPQGYDTQIGAGGIGLSSGQTQQVAIARAMFGDPAIILLDEPTAHLDSEGQLAFAASVARLRLRKVTVLFASHNNETLSSADKLLVMSAGRVEKMLTAQQHRTAAPPPPAPAAAAAARAAAVQTPNIVQTSNLVHSFKPAVSQ